TSWELSGEAAALRDGVYQVAVRPNHVAPVQTQTACVPLTGTVLVTELSGSDSSAHFSIGEDVWVSLAHGVHSYEIGAAHPFYLDPSKCFYFAADGQRVA
ncbi:MAG: ABC transporter ATP-binding protein, partial [Marinovum sp.]|nr:ABC transporter ATP-binding protein [Marinovum sp.]